MLLWIINGLLTILGLLFAKYPRNYGILHPKKLFVYFFLIVQVSGFFFARLIKLIDGNYKVSDDVLLTISLITFYSFTIFVVSYYIWKKIIPLNIIKFPKLYVGFFRKLYSVFFLLGSIGILIYYLKNGFVLFKEGGYENKNIANIGLGYARLMYSIGFSYFILSYLLFSFNKKRLRRTLYVSLFLGVLIFVIIGGGRAASLGLFIECIIIGLYYKYFSKRKLITLGIILFVIIITLTIVRYKLNLSSETMVLLLYQLQGSFSPIDSFAIIYKHFSFNENFVPNIAFNSFLTLIPRFIWTDKPIEINVPSVYFTREILNYPSFLTISPTLLGELYMYGGILSITVGMFLIALIVRIFVLIYIKSFVIPSARVFFILNALIYFSLFREGLSIFVRDIFLKIIVFISIIFAIEIISSISIKKFRGNYNENINDFKYVSVKK